MRAALLDDLDRLGAGRCTCSSAVHVSALNDLQVGDAMLRVRWDGQQQDGGAEGGLDLGGLHAGGQSLGKPNAPRRICAAFLSFFFDVQTCVRGVPSNVVSV